jgi:hypothetical protein
MEIVKKVIAFIVLFLLIPIGATAVFGYCYNYSVMLEENKYHCINNLLYRQVNDNTFEFLNKSCVGIDKD